MPFDPKQLRLLTDRLVNDGMNEWTYDDTVDIATVVAAGYIVSPSPGGQGMSVGDRVFYRRWAAIPAKTTLTSISEHTVSAINATTGAVTLAGGGASILGSVAGATRTLTSAESGSVVYMDRAAGTIFTLPTPVQGLSFQFVVATTVTSNNHKIITAAGTQFLVGSLLSIDTDTSDAAVGFSGNGTTHVACTMNGTTTGGIIGTVIRVRAISATQWVIEGTLRGSGTVATPFATS